jgi:hypothetical protein
MRDGSGLVAALVLGLTALWPAANLEAGNPHVFRFQAEWLDNADGSDCDRPATSLSLVSSQADVDVVSFVYQFNLEPCDPASPLETVQATGQVEIRGNLARLFVEGDIPTSDAREVTIDLCLRKTGNLPDPAPGEKEVSAKARGQVILDGVDLTGGRSSTSARITRSRS